MRGVPAAGAGEVGRGTALFREMGTGARRGGGTAFVGEGVTSQGFQNFQNGVRRCATVDGGVGAGAKDKGRKDVTWML